jgi:D-tyrosyl-tRNA(Tyr) deacylase
VTRAEVRIGGESIGSIGRGLVILLGVAPGDDESVAAALAAKIASLRIFADTEGLTNLSIREMRRSAAAGGAGGSAGARPVDEVSDVGGSALVVSQFTLFADARRGRRPSFVGAAGLEVGERLYESFCGALAAAGVPVERGRFGADMAVELVNDGPFTVWLDTVDLGIVAKSPS